MLAAYPAEGAEALDAELVGLDGVTTLSQVAATRGLQAGSFVNVADVGGTYNGTWVQAVSRWVISVYGKPTVPKLPRTAAQSECPGGRRQRRGQD